MIDDLEPSTSKGNPNKRNGLVLLVVVVVLLVGVLGFAIWVLQPTNSLPVSSKSTAFPTVLIPTLAVGNPSSQNTIFDIKGNGPINTSTFSVDGNWDLYWAYDCSNFGQGNFTVYIYENAKLSFETGSVTQFGAKANNVVHYHNGGKYYLQVISSCAWNLKGVNF